MFDFSGRTALVTGGASGIGQAIASALSEHGADLILLDRDGDGLKKVAAEISQKTNREVQQFPVDVTLRGDLEKVHESLGEGQPDILVNAAGFNCRKPISELTEAEFISVLNVHVLACFNTTQLFTEGMARRGKGAILNIASIAAYRTLLPRVSPYVAGKAAIKQFTCATALEFVDKGIRANSISPGFIDTPLTQQHSDEVRKALTDTVPMGRFGEPHEIANAALFLLSDYASYITGTDLVCDGGFLSK